MAQMTDDLALAILNGAGVTRHEVEQLARHWLKTAQIAAPASEPTQDFENECGRLRNMLRMADRTYEDQDRCIAQLRSVLAIEQQKIAQLAAPADLVRRLLADHQLVEPHHADMCVLCREAQAAIDGQPAPSNSHQIAVKQGERQPEHRHTWVHAEINDRFYTCISCGEQRDYKAIQQSQFGR